VTDTTIEALFGSRIAELVEDAVSATRADKLRATLAFTRHIDLEAGCYDVADAPGLANAPDLADLVALASRRTGRSLAIAEARVLRFHPGDYLLAHADRVHDDHPIELVIDLSEHAIPGPELHYRRRGQVYFRVPSQPGIAAIVERGPTVTCNHTYVTKRQTGSVTRAILLLR
jgi:hypothetical protein